MTDVLMLSPLVWGTLIGAVYASVRLIGLATEADHQGLSTLYGLAVLAVLLLATLMIVDLRTMADGGLLG